MVYVSIINFGITKNLHILNLLFISSLHEMFVVLALFSSKFNNQTLELQ